MSKKGDIECPFCGGKVIVKGESVFFHACSNGCYESHNYFTSYRAAHFAAAKRFTPTQIDPDKMESALCELAERVIDALENEWDRTHAQNIAFHYANYIALKHSLGI